MVYVDMSDKVKETYKAGNVIYKNFDGRYTEDIFPILGMDGWIMCGVDNKHSNEPAAVTAYWFYRELF